MSQPAAQEQAPGSEAAANIGTVFTKFRKFLQRRPTLAFLLCAPLLALVIGLIVYPFFYSINLSLLNRKETRFVGLANYLFLFKRDTFWMVVRQSVLFTLTAVFFKALIGFIMAHLIDAIPTHRQRLWRGLALIPWVMPPALSTLGWWWIFRSQPQCAQLDTPNVFWHVGPLVERNLLGAVLRDSCEHLVGKSLFPDHVSGRVEISTGKSL